MPEFNPQNFASRTPERKLIQVAEILDGKEAKDLLDAMRMYQLESGDIVMAGTDKGINYKDHNEDRVVAAPKENFLAVVDGMGGMGNGDQAAQILAEEFSVSPLDIRSAAFLATQKMAKQDILRGGAVFVSARLIKIGEAKHIESFQCGDAKLMVISKEGDVKFETRDDTIVQKLVEIGNITPDEALYDHRRNIVNDAVSPTSSSRVGSSKPIPVETGDLVLLMSDGVSDNFMAEDIAKKVKEGLTAVEIFKWLSEETSRRMTDAQAIKNTSNRKENGIFSDGYKSEPKPDNRALAIMEIK